MPDPIVSKGLSGLSQISGELQKAAETGKKGPAGKFEQVRNQLAEQIKTAGLDPGSVEKPREVSMAERFAARDGIAWQPNFETTQSGKAGADPWAPKPVEPVEKKGMTEAVKGLSDGQHRLESIIDELKSGRQFDRAELLGIQAEVSKLTEELQLTTKLVDSAMQGIKNMLQQQV